MSGKIFSGFYQCPYILVACKMDIPCSTCEDFHTYIKERNLLRTTQQGMSLVKDNSYLLDYDKEEVIGYIFNDDIYAEKGNSSIFKDTDTAKVFVNISQGSFKKMVMCNRGYETFYGYPLDSRFFEIHTISVVIVNNINDETHKFWWVNKTYEDAFILSEKLKQKENV